MTPGTFSLVPLEVIQDRRLSLIQTRVLIALFSYRGKDTNVVYPSRERLRSRCGYQEVVISRTTAELVDLGWLIKTGKGGYGKATRYEIKIPDCLETVTDPVTVTGPVTVTDQVQEQLPIRCKNSDRSGNTKEKGREKKETKDTSPRRRTKKTFTPPTIEEAQGYAKEKELNVDARKFIDYFEEGDWHDSHGKPVKNWKQKMLTWANNDAGKPQAAAAARSDRVTHADT